MTMPFGMLNDIVARRQMGLKKPDGYNPYAAGDKRYGPSGRAAPNQGPVGAEGQRGYRERDQRAKGAAIRGRMKAAQNGNYMSPDYLRGQV